MKSPKPSSTLENWLAEKSGSTSTTDAMLKDAKQKLRDRARSDFWWFAFHCCGYQDIDNKFHHKTVATWNKYRHEPFSIWLFPRFHLKTSLFTIADALYEAVQKPLAKVGSLSRICYQGADRRLLIKSAKLDLVHDICFEIKSIVANNELFRYLFPEYCIDLAPRTLRDKCRDRQTEWDWPCRTRWLKEPSISVGAVDAPSQGRHFDGQSYDDAQTDYNISTPDVRNSVHAKVLDCWSLRQDGTSRIRWPMTRWHHDDIAGREIRRELEYRRQKMLETGKEPKPKVLVFRKPVLNNGEPLWPERFGTDEIEDTKRRLGPYQFSCQFELDPTSPEQALFKRHWIQRCYESDIAGNKLVTVAAIDLAVKDRETSDYTVITVCSFDDTGAMYVRQIVRRRTSNLDEVTDILISLVERWSISKVAIEKIAFQETVNQIYKRKLYARGVYVPWAEMVRQRTTKFSRWSAMQPLVANGDFYVIHGIENAEALYEEMTTVTPDHMPANDDILDTLADCYKIGRNPPSTVASNIPPDAVARLFPGIFNLEPDEPELAHYIGSEDY